MSPIISLCCRIIEARISQLLNTKIYLERFSFNFWPTIALCPMHKEAAVLKKADVEERCAIHAEVT
jgi:hypothetical protein